MISTVLFRTLFLLTTSLIIVSCGDNPAESDKKETELSGSVSLDGSSTVFPISEAVAEEFMRIHPDVRVTVGESGTGAGFKKFGRGEVDINNASRPIKSGEDSLAKSNNISYEQMLIAYDGLAVVVNPQNTWCSNMTVDELKRLWEPAAQGKIMRWNQIRPDWPAKEIHLFGAGTQSGTFDYFTEAIVGKAKECRGDYTASEDDNVLVQGVSADENALGFFGLAYFENNSDKLKLVGIDDGNAENGDGSIKPSLETVKNKTYVPLSRPLFIYINNVAAERPEVQAFVNFYMEQSPILAKEVGYVPVSEDELTTEKARLNTFLKSLQ